MANSHDQEASPGTGAGQVTPSPAARQSSDPKSERSKKSSTDGTEETIVKHTTKGKLMTYQIAAVVSAVLAGTESQLLLFFKAPSNFVHLPAPSTLQWLLILTYTALIFSISSTISSLVLTENFGDSLRLAERLRKVKKRLRLRNPLRRRKELPIHMMTPRRWKWMEYHWLFTLVVSVLCLLIQILVYIWTQELVIVKAVIAGVGIFAMFPLLHFLPIRWGSRGIVSKGDSTIRSLEEGTATTQPLALLMRSPPSVPIILSPLGLTRSHSPQPTVSV